MLTLIAKVEIRVVIFTSNCREHFSACNLIVVRLRTIFASKCQRKNSASTVVRAISLF